MIPYLDRWRADYQFKTFFTSACSALLGIGFAVFNGALGFIHRSVWNGSICVYYVLLTIVRGIILLSQRRYGSTDSDRNRKIFLRTHVLMILMDLCLIAPIAYMVMGQRSYTFGMIPAIAMAAYTTCRISMGIFQYRKSRKHENLLVKELRVINLQDALVAVLSLQNALIIACGSGSESMIGLTGWTSAGVWLLILFFTVRSFLSFRTMQA